jgi:hypothetical protein
MTPLSVSHPLLRRAARGGQGNRRDLDARPGRARTALDRTYRQEILTVRRNADPMAEERSSDVGTADEGEHERLNRELIELLNELRVALPGVQVLFAFLLAVPFAQGFTTVTAFERDLFFATLAATAISSVLLIAPSAWHRLHFRQRNKEELLFASNRFAIAGLGFLAVAMIGAVMLIADYIFSPVMTVVSGAIATALFVVFWAALPLATRPGRPQR